jgi:hypothetical protein
MEKQRKQTCYQLFESPESDSPTPFLRSFARTDTVGDDGIAGPSGRGEAAGGGGRGGCGCRERFVLEDNGDELAILLSSAFKAIAL